MAYVHLARANYENVQNAKFVQKFVHTFARTVAKLRSNFRFAELSNMTATETATEKVRYMYCTFLQVLQVLPRVRGVMYSWYPSKIKVNNNNN